MTKTASRTTRMQQPRKRIGRYLITGRIGRGGMGMVYRGVDELLEREVAVKTLTVEGTLDAESRRRFEVEAKAAAKLQHPNIVTVYELGEDRGIPFIAMELLPGSDLESLVRSGEPLLLGEKLEIVTQVCRGLAYAHERGVIHRDIKLTNIRVLDDGTAKIMDFGIAKLGSTSLTRTGMMVGTIHYMSPEQIRGQTLDGRSDVFSVGVILFELLAGKRPFAGQGATEVLYKIVHDPPPPLEGDLGQEAPELQAIVHKALEKSPDARYATASHLADALAKLLLAQSKAQSEPAAITEGLSAARRLAKEKRFDEAVRRLRELSIAAPHSVELRRALRSTTAEMRRPEKARPPEGDDFPELEATFHASPTQKSSETELQPTVLDRAPAAATSSRTRTPFLWSAAALAAFVLAGVVWFARARRPAAAALPRAPTPIAADSAAGKAAPPAALLKLITDPPGALVSVDGESREARTPQTLALDPRRDHTLAISLDGRESKEVALKTGQIPGELRVDLPALPPPGHVAILSAYPVDVVWHGRTLSKENGQVMLPPGRHTLALVSSSHFLRSDVTVDVRSGKGSSVSAPALGTINVRANPDNCQVFIDGGFVDYPPILDRAIAAGPHRIAFRWADGTRREEEVSVATSRPVYVMGRRD